MVLIVSQSIDCFAEVKKHRKFDLFRDKLNIEFESSTGHFSGITLCFLLAFQQTRDQQQFKTSCNSNRCVGICPRESDVINSEIDTCRNYRL